MAISRFPLPARRRARRLEAQQALALQALHAPAPDDSLLVAYATQTGYAESLAAQTAESLRAGGLTVRVASLDQLDLARLAGYRRMLFVVSTYGEGDSPDAGAAFADQMQPAGPAAPALAGAQYAVLALGDSLTAGYGLPPADGFTTQLQAALRQAVGSPPGPVSRR